MAAISETHIDLRAIHQLGDTRERLVACPAFADHGIVLAGISRAGRGFEFHRPRPDMCQVLACCGGEGEVLVDGAWCSLGPGQAYCTPPHCRHHYRQRGNGIWLLAWVIAEAGVGLGPATPRRLTGDVRSLYDAIHHLHRESLSPNETTMVARWADLVAACARRLGQAGDDGNQRLTPVWQAVADDLAHRWTLAELAELAGMSAEHLRRLSHRHTGRSPMQQVAWIRLQHARRQVMLAETSIATIASRVGYANPYAFSTAFRRLWGRPPSAWRRGAAG